MKYSKFVLIAFLVFMLPSYSSATLSDDIKLAANDCIENNYGFLNSTEIHASGFSMTTVKPNLVDVEFGDVLVKGDSGVVDLTFGINYYFKVTYNVPAIQEGFTREVDTSEDSVSIGSTPGADYRTHGWTIIRDATTTGLSQWINWKYYFSPYIFENTRYIGRIEYFCKITNTERKYTERLFTLTAEHTINITVRIAMTMYIRGYEGEMQDVVDGSTVNVPLIVGGIAVIIGVYLFTRRKRK